MAGCTILCPKQRDCSQWLDSAIRLAKGDPPALKDTLGRKWEKGIERRIEEQKNGLCRPGTPGWKRHEDQINDLLTGLNNAINKFDTDSCGALLGKDIPKEVRDVREAKPPGQDFIGKNFNDKMCEEKIEQPFLARRADEAKAKAEKAKNVGHAALAGLGALGAIVLLAGADALSEGAATPAIAPAIAEEALVLSESSAAIFGAAKQFFSVVKFAF